MMRCLKEYRKKWRTRRQMKPGWQKQKEKEEFGRPIIEKEIAIARIVEEKEKDEEEEEDLIELRVVEEMVPK